MKKEYNEMMDGIRLSSEARKRIETAFNEKKKRKISFKSLRVAAVAAVMCTLLAVGAVASELAKTPQISGENSGEDESSYDVKAEVKLFSLKSELSALAAAIEGGELRTSFNGKQELESYLGIALAESELLATSGIVENLEESFEYGFDLYPALKKDADARFVLSMYDGNGEECVSAPHVIRVVCHRVVQNTEVYIEASVFTDNYDVSKLESGVVSEKFGSETYIISSVYVDEEGKIQYDAKSFCDAKYTFTTSEYEMKNGNTAMIVTAEKDMGVTPGHKEYIAYFVQDGILYTVRPYAIYDADKDFPKVNGDELIPMYAILDSIE